MIKVYQIKDQKAIYPDVSFMYGIGKFQPKDHLDKYVHVADLDCDTLNDAFEIGNIGPEEKYTRYNSMHSVSVGDLLVDDQADTYIVANFGFEQINTDFGYAEVG